MTNQYLDNPEPILPNNDEDEEVIVENMRDFPENVRLKWEPLHRPDSEVG